MNTTSSRFVANAWGYTYEWEIVGGVEYDSDGLPYVWARPIRRISGHKRGRLRAKVAWYFSPLPPRIYR